MKILQSHVDELDGFIERTTDDFLLAHGDVQQRLQYLKLPLENIKVFDEMLEDRSFRNSVIDENEKIEHVIERSAVALNDSFKDIQKGIDAVNMLWSYLKQLAKEWTPGPGRFDVVYAAMIGNVEGWNDALLKLQTKGSDLAVVLVQLGVAVSEIQRRVGMASRKDVVRISTPYQLMLLQRLNYPDADQKSVVLSPSTRPRAKSLRERFFERASVAAQNPGAPDKPLPSDPGPLDPAIERAFSTRIPAQRIARQSFPNLRHVESPGARPGAVPRRSRSFNDAANRASRNRSLPKIPETTAAGFKKKLPKTVSWTKPHPGDKLATGSRPATAPSRSLQARSRSLEQLETGVAEGKSSFRTVLDSLVQPEKKKPPLTPAAREKARDQLLHHFKSKRALDIVFLASKEQKPSRRTLAAKRDWPFSVFRAKSSKDPNRSVEASEFKNLGADQSPLSGSKSEHEMTWSHAEPDIPNTHTLKANPSGSPRLPMFPLCTPVKENFEDEKADQEEEAESELTALPSLGPSVVSKFDHAISQKPTAYICADSTLRVHESPLNSDAQSSPLDAIDTVDPDTGSLKTLEDKIPQNTEPLAVSSDSATSEMTRGCKSLPIDLASPPSVESQLSVPLRSSKRESETANQKSASCERPKDLQNLAFLTSESLIEFLAATPPASPYPPANSPEISKQQENRSSRARLGLGIRVGLHPYPEEVSSPPPPGPGGRAMVSPDYAAQFAFEGEKRMKKRRSFGGVGAKLISRKRSLRRLFSVSSKENITGGIVSAARSNINGDIIRTTPPTGNAEMTSSMNEGEIFSFHGMRKDGTWVST